MYWNSVPSTSVNFEGLLKKKDVTLQEIMDDNRILEECKAQNFLLIEYLLKPDVLEKLIKFTTEEPSGKEDEAAKYKYSNIACELLTCEVPQLSESLASNKDLLEKLYSFLDSDPPLNPLLASFFSQILSALITRKSEQHWYSHQFTCLKVLEFLKLKEDSISLLLKHLGTSAIMDLVLKLVTTVEGSDLKEIVWNWLDEENLVQRLVALLDPSVDADRHSNASKLLCDLINFSRTDQIEVFQPNKILERIESSETVELLLDHVLKEPKCESSIVGGISVLLELLKDSWVGDPRYGLLMNPLHNADHLKVVASTTKAILPRLKDFHDILVNPPHKPTIRTTIAVLEPPLGNIRVEVAKLLACLVESKSLELNEKLIELDTVNVLLDLFFKYTWNNFLHTQVEKFLEFAIKNFETPDGGDNKNSLVAYILSKCRLIQRILDAWQDNETQQIEHKRPRRGYMGHLVNIADNICSSSELDSFGALMKETVDNETLNKWETFINTKYCRYHIENSYIGAFQLSEKDDGSERNGSIGDYSQELYSNYCQLQSLVSTNNVDFVPFSANQFNEDEDILNVSTHSNFEKINFNLTEEEIDEQAVNFEKICTQKFQTLDDHNGYVRNETSDSNDDAERNWGNSSSDEEDEENSEKRKNSPKSDSLFNDVSPWSEKPNLGTFSVDNSNPWDTSNVNAVASPDVGWANFESATFVPSFGLNFTPDINTTIASSTSYEIGTTPLDLTPSENNCNIDEIFSASEPKMETPVVEDHSPSTATVTDLEIITKSANNLSLNQDEPKSSEEKIVKGSEENSIEEISKASSEEGVSLREEKTSGFVETSLPIGDINSVDIAKEKKDTLENSSRILSPEVSAIMANSEKGPDSPEGGDSNQLLKENVQAVPNESTQTSNTEVPTSSTEDKSAKGSV